MPLNLDNVSLDDQPKGGGFAKFPKNEYFPFHVEDVMLKQSPTSGNHYLTVKAVCDQEGYDNSWVYNNLHFTKKSVPITAVFLKALGLKGSINYEQPSDLAEIANQIEGRPFSASVFYDKSTYNGVEREYAKFGEVLNYQGPTKSAPVLDDAWNEEDIAF